jgi:hypothetical protein
MPYALCPMHYLVPYTYALLGLQVQTKPVSRNQKGPWSSGFIGLSMPYAIFMLYALSMPNALPMPYAICTRYALCPMPYVRHMPSALSMPIALSMPSALFTPYDISMSYALSMPYALFMPYAPSMHYLCPNYALLALKRLLNHLNRSLDEEVMSKILNSAGPNRVYHHMTVSYHRDGMTRKTQDD